MTITNLPEANDVFSSSWDEIKHDGNKLLVFLRLTYLEDPKAVLDSRLALSLEFEDILVRLGRLKKSLTEDHPNFDAVARCLAKHWAEKDHKEMEVRDERDLTISTELGAVLRAVRVLDQSGLAAFVVTPAQVMPYIVRVVTLELKWLELKPVGPVDLLLIVRMLYLIQTVSPPPAVSPAIHHTCCGKRYIHDQCYGPSRVPYQTSLAEESRTRGPPPTNALVRVHLPPHEVCGFGHLCHNNGVARLIKQEIKIEMSAIQLQLNDLTSQMRDMVVGPSSGDEGDD